MQTPASSTLSRHTRACIVAITVGQSALLLLAWLLGEHTAMPLGPRVVWTTLAATVPAMMALSVVRIADHRFWQHVAGIAAVCALLGSWAAWSVSGAPGIDTGNVLEPFALTLAGTLFVALPFLQCRQQNGPWRAPYAQLFDHAWHNALTVALALAFTAVCWLVLHLWAELFELVHIAFFHELFFAHTWFAYLATGLFAGIGLQVGRSQPQPLRVVRRILFTLCRGLLPLTALVALLFLASLPFTGLAPLWAMHTAAGLLLGLLVLLVILLNAVWQDGTALSPYPRVLRWLIDAALLVAPIYAGLALYALALRIGQYGWSGSRLFAVLAAVMLAGYSIGYAFAAVRRHGGWLTWLPRINVTMALAAMVLAALVNSPALDPWRITVASQIDRLHAGTVTPAKLDIRTLRYDSGRRGYEAVLALRHDPLVQADPVATAQIADAINQVQKNALHLQRGERIRTVARLRQYLPPAQGSTAPDDSWYAAVLDKRLGQGECARTDARCVVLDTDLRGDGARQNLLCHYDRGIYRDYAALDCRVTLRNRRGQWLVAGRLRFDNASTDDKRAIWKALRAGAITPKRPRWPDVTAAGITAQIMAIRPPAPPASAASTAAATR